MARSTNLYTCMPVGSIHLMYMSLVSACVCMRSSTYSTVQLYAYYRVIVAYCNIIACIVC